MAGVGTLRYLVVIVLLYMALFLLNLRSYRWFIKRQCVYFCLLEPLAVVHTLFTVVDGGRLKGL